MAIPTLWFANLPNAIIPHHLFIHVPASFASSLFHRLLILGGCSLAAPTLGTAHAESPSQPSGQGWQLTQHYQFAQAQHAFDRELENEAETNTRDLQLGAALATLNHPALKTGDRKRSLTELQQLWDSRGETPDRAGLWAGYLLGRWSQNYDSPSDFDQALDWFERTASAGGETYVAQLARLKATGLWLYAPLHTNPETSRRLSQALAVKSQITDRGLRISYLFLLIDGMLLRKVDHQQVLAHLEELWALDITDLQARAKTLCQLGTLSAMAGHRESAIDYYEQFLNEFPVDIRTQLVRDRLAELTTAQQGGQL